MSTETSDEMSTADLVDLHGEALQSIPLQLQSFGRRTRFAGRAVTVKCFEDNSLVKAALDSDWQPADVDGDGRLDRVAVATDHSAGRACRAFVGIRTAAGTTYATALDRTAPSPDQPPTGGATLINSFEVPAVRDAAFVASSGFGRHVRRPARRHAVVDRPANRR